MFERSKLYQRYLSVSLWWIFNEVHHSRIQRNLLPLMISAQINDGLGKFFLLKHTMWCGIWPTGQACPRLMSTQPPSKTASLNLVEFQLEKKNVLNKMSAFSPLTLQLHHFCLFSKNDFLASVSLRFNFCRENNLEFRDDKKPVLKWTLWYWIF